jgi:chromosomal replication initiator protein
MRIREATKWSLPRIGQFFGGRDHTTVLHSLRRMEDRAARDPDLRAYMDEVRLAYLSQQPPSR